MSHGVGAPEAIRAVATTLALLGSGAAVATLVTTGSLAEAVQVSFLAVAILAFGLVLAAGIEVERGSTHGLRRAVTSLGRRGHHDRSESGRRASPKPTEAPETGRRDGHS